jgi:hypothetical protein
MQRYQVLGSVRDDRVFFIGTWEECISFMKRVSGCRGPYLEGYRP